MSKSIKVSELRAKLDALPDDLPVFLFDLDSDEAYPIQLVDPMICDRVDLNFSSQEKKTYRAHVAVYHSFVVEASSEDQAKRLATEDVNWDDHVTDCEITVEEEVKDDD